MSCKWCKINSIIQPLHYNNTTISQWTNSSHGNGCFNYHHRSNSTTWLVAIRHWEETLHENPDSIVFILGLRCINRSVALEEICTPARCMHNIVLVDKSQHRQYPKRISFFPRMSTSKLKQPPQKHQRSNILYCLWKVYGFVLIVLHLKLVWWVSWSKLL